MFFQILCLSALGVIHVGLGTSEGGRKYRSLGRANNNGSSFRCLTEGFHPDSRDCRTFYRCVDFASNDYFRDYTEPHLTAFRFECGEGTVFDPDFNICNHPRQTRRAECGAEGGQNPGAYPSQDGQNEGYRVQGQNQDRYPISYPGLGNMNEYPVDYPAGGNHIDYPVDYPGGGNQNGYPAGYPGGGNQNGHPEGYPGEGNQNGRPAGYPGGGNQDGRPEGYPGGGNQNGHPPGYPGGGNQNSRPEGYPGGGNQDGRPAGYPGGGNQDGRPEGYPGGGNQDGRPEGYPGGGNQNSRPESYPGGGNQNGHPAGYPAGGNQNGRPESYPAGGNQNSRPEGYPGGGNQNGHPEGYPGGGNKDGHPVSHPEGGNQNGRPAGNPGGGNQNGRPAGNPAGGNQNGRPAGYPGGGNQNSRPEGYPGGGNQNGRPAGNPAGGNQNGRPAGYPGGGNQNSRPGGYPGGGNQNSRPEGYPGGGNQNGRPAGYPGGGNQNGHPAGYPGGGNQDGHQGQGGYPKESENEIMPMGQEVSHQTPVSLSESCRSPGFFPIKGDCQKFIRCVDNGDGGYAKYEFTCSHGKVWDPVNSICSSHSQVPGCEVRQGSQKEQGGYPNQGPDAKHPDQGGKPGHGENGSKPEGSTQGQMFSGNCNAPGFYGVPGNCKKYIRCVDNGKGGYTKYEFVCGEGTAWDIQLNTCNHAYLVESCDNQASTTTSPQSTPAYNNSTSTKPTTKKPEMSSQSKDPSKPPPGSSPCDKNKLSGPIKCEKDGFYPDPSDCSKFYRCADWGNKKFSVYYFECSEGTIWDPALETCNHEKSVYPPRNCTRPSTEIEQRPTSTGSTPSPATKEPSTTPPSTPSNTQRPTTQNPTTSSNTEPSTTAAVTSPEDSTTANPTTVPEDSSTMATESNTSVPTTMSSNTDSTEQTTKPSSKGPESTSTTPSEEFTEGSTMSQTDPTTSNPEQTESTTSQEMTTTTKPSGGKDPKCPELNEDQSAFVCPTGFRRHPKNCNSFYQCTTSKDTGDLNIMVFSCNKDTVYDERKIQCLPADETESCQQQGQGRVYRSAKEEFSSVVYVSPYKRLCPEEGSFPYEGDCTRFYKCKKDTRGKIQGYLYQCPENYSFDDATGRCEESSKLPPCGRSIPEVTARTLKWMKDKVPVDFSFL